MIKYKCHVSSTYEKLDDMLFCDACVELLAKHPSSTFEEIESYYCTGCLENMPSSDAVTYNNRCSKCFDCPACNGTLSIFTFAEKGGPQVSEGEGEGATNRRFYFACFHCRWTSKECGIVEDSVTQLTAAVLSMESKAGITGSFQAILAVHKRTKGVKGKTFPVPWKWGDVEAELRNTQERQKSMSLVQRDQVLLHSTLPEGSKGWIEAVGRDKDTEYDIAIDGLNHLSMRERLQQVCANSRKDLIPLRKPLKTKRSRRCVKCVQNNRSGILVKPQISPLHGDSSRVVDVGSWFKKQNSARNFVPNISIYSVDRDSSCVVIRIVNPASNHLSPITSDVSLLIRPGARVGEDGKDNGSSTEDTVVPLIANEGPYIICNLDELDAEKELSKMDFKDDTAVVVGRTFNSILFRIPFRRISTTTSEGKGGDRDGVSFSLTMEAEYATAAGPVKVVLDTVLSVHCEM